MKKLRKLTKAEDDRINQAIKDDPDTFEATAEQIVSAQRGRPRLLNPKAAISIRLDEDIIAHFKNTGKGWQTRMNDALKRLVEADKS